MIPGDLEPLDVWRPAGLPLTMNTPWNACARGIIVGEDRPSIYGS